MFIKIFFKILISQGPILKIESPMTLNDLGNTAGFEYLDFPADFCLGPDCPVALSPGPDPGTLGNGIKALTWENRLYFGKI